MKTLKEIKGRIKSIKSTSKITQAMKIVAVSTLKKSENKIKKSKDYESEINKFLYGIYKNEKYKIEIEKIVKEKGERDILIIIGADKGLCGDFINKITNKIKEIKIEKKSKILLIGKKIVIRKASWNNKISFLKEKFERNLFFQSLEIASKIISNKSIEKCRVIYTKFYSIRKREIKIENIFCIEDFIKKNRFEKKNNEEYECDICDEKENCIEYCKKYLIEFIVKKYIASKIYNIFNNSIASECSARMISMHNATKNSNQMIKGLTLSYNKKRQEIITRELIEVISGSESTK